LVEKLKNARVKGTYLYFISLGRLVGIDCRGYPGREIDNLIGFIEGYRADPEKIGDCFARNDTNVDFLRNHQKLEYVKRHILSGFRNNPPVGLL